MRNVIVTGASRGLGLAMAGALAAAGYRVIGIARGSNADLEAAQRTAGGGPGAIELRAFDLAQVDRIGPFVRALRGEFGPFHGLVNNAGIGTPGLLATLPDGDVERLVRINTVSPIVLTKYVVRSMMAERAGRIVNIASVVAATGYSGLSVYSATKASLVGFTRSLAREVGPLGITVNAVAPGFIATSMTADMSEAERSRHRAAQRLEAQPRPHRRGAQRRVPAGRRGRNITGTVITVDAGNTA